MPDEVDEPRNVTPFKLIRRGEDTLDIDERVVFADFSPTVLPADTPDEVVEVLAPKDVSVPVPAPSSESMQTSVPLTLETTVPVLVEEGDGKTNLIEPMSPTSSLDLKIGPSEPLA